LHHFTFVTEAYRDIHFIVDSSSEHNLVLASKVGLQARLWLMTVDDFAFSVLALIPLSMKGQIVPNAGNRIGAASIRCQRLYMQKDA